MFLNLDTYFIGPISLPQLPISRMGEEYEDYGMAKMVQTVGETNLQTYIDEKAAEYLRFMFGYRMCDDILSAWFDYISDVEEVETGIITLDDSCEKDVWTPVIMDFDLLFSNLISTLEKPSVDNRFGNLRRIEWIGDGFKIKFKINADGTAKYYVSGSIIATVEIIETHREGIPPLKIRKILNAILTYSGETKVSPVANYVWYQVTKDGNNNTTSMGEADLNFSRATSAYESDKFLKTVTLRNKLITTWNSMVKMNMDVISFIRSNRDIFEEYEIPYQNHRNMIERQNSFNM